MTSARCAVLGLFPAIGPGRIGGVQASGLAAWAAIRDSAGVGDERCRLFCYGQPGDVGSSVETGALLVRGKSQAIRVALSHHWQPRLTLVWHAALLRLLPFFRVGRRPLILFLHGIEAWRRHDPLTRLLFKRVTLFLTNSAYTWQRFIETYPSLHSARHQVVHLGTGAPLKMPCSQIADPPAVLMLGRLLHSEDYKGHRELIDAWPLVVRRVPGAQMWIAGDGDMQPALQRLIDERNLAGSISVLGGVSEDQKQDLLHRSRCLALPSRGEGFGLVYLEAMRACRPCLVSDCDAGREVVNPPESGLAASPHDPAALADAVCRLLTPGAEWDRMSAAARHRYEANFTAAQFQRRLLAALHPFLT